MANRGFEIAGIPVKNRFVLAPLAGFTDYSLRKLSSDMGAGLVYTEMESCESLLHGSQATLEDLKNTHRDRRDEKDTRLALQIFGGKAESILQSIPLFEKEAEYDFLDFNVGCPVPKVMRQRAGSYWLNRLDELFSLLEKMVSISRKPVIVKIRIGFDEIMDVRHVCRKMESCGVKAIAVHGRTRKEGFMSPVHYDIIRAIKESVSIPVIANGAIDERNFLDVLEETKADAVMIGQRAIGYPKVFQDMVRVEQGLAPIENTLKSQVDTLKEHLRLMFSCKEEKPASDIMRGISVRYLKGFGNIKETKLALVHCRSLDEYLSVLSRLPFENQVQ